ncbi:MAG: alpha-hydroxy-acid oxidizing protein [Bacteroidia bacterium]|nr:alpha-hydroxy-acid oxidizing protein [Bacteroidia bacterium]
MAKVELREYTKPTTMSNVYDYQRSIYLNGISGRKPLVPIDLNDLEGEAEKYMAPGAFSYVSTGAGAEETLSANRKAFQSWEIVPRILRDVSQIDSSVELFGEKLSSPIMLCPIGALDLAHPQKEIAVARACEATGMPMIISSQASTPMEDITAAMPNALNWYQLYWSKSPEMTQSFVRRAEQSGCKAIVLTVDTATLGWRKRDLNEAYSPFLRGKGIAQYTSDPVFQKLMEMPSENGPTPRPRITPQTIATLFAQARNVPGGFFSNLRSGKGLKSVRTFARLFSRPDLEWRDISKLKEMTTLPVLIKGIVHPDDAKLAIEYGADGIIVSNHGGRQVDGSIGTLHALQSISGEVKGKIPVLIDGGIRSGADVFKALAWGASAVCIGRPYAYGLAIAGQKGVEEVIMNLKADFSFTMALSGCRSVTEVGINSLKYEWEV